MTRTVHQLSSREKIVVNWLSIADGSYSEVIPEAYGQLVRAVFVPGTAGL